MKDNRILCDHCGKVLNNMVDYPEIELFDIGCPASDLCKDCYKELQTLIRSFVRKEEVK